MAWNYDLHKVQYPLNPRKYVVQVVSSPTTLDESQTDNLQVKFYTNFNSHSIHVSAFSHKKSQFFSSNQSCQMSSQPAAFSRNFSQILVEISQTQIESFFHIALNFGIIHITPHSPSVFHVRKWNNR